MGKKNKQNHGKGGPTPETTAPSGFPLISKRGWKVVFGGISVGLVGYFILSKTDPMGQNWASHVSPFLILAGYTIIGIGLTIKDPH